MPKNFKQEMGKNSTNSDFLLGINTRMIPQNVETGCKNQADICFELIAEQNS